MGALSDLIQDPVKRKAVVNDSVRAIDAEVAGKRGLSGAVVKAGFKMVKGVSPGFIPMALDHLLDDFARQVDPFYTDWKDGENGSLDSYFQRRAPEIADALLTITDDLVTLTYALEVGGEVTVHFAVQNKYEGS